MTTTYEADLEEYQRLAHAMQTGIAFREDKHDQTPKHLRVGVNMALLDAGALALLLVEKGVFTKEEHLKALLVVLRQEVERYRQLIAAEKGIPMEKITLV